MLGPATVVKGQLAWYTGQPRFFVGKETVRALVLRAAGPAADAGSGGDGSRSTPTCRRSCCGTRSRTIILVGKLVAPRQLVGVLQLLTTEKVGTITVAEDDDGQR